MDQCPLVYPDQSQYCLSCVAYSSCYFRLLDKTDSSKIRRILQPLQTPDSVVTLLAIILGILFQHQNVAFIAVMPMVISASVNFPILILAMYWRGLTTRAAVAGGLIGFVSSILLIVAGPKVWVSIIGAESPLFPYDYPALFTMTAAFITIVVISLLDNSSGARQDRDKFDQQVLMAELGLDPNKK